LRRFLSFHLQVSTKFSVVSVKLWSSESATGYPYSGITSTTTMLAAVKAHWNTNKQTVSRTIVHMLSGREFFGGLAYMSALCHWHRDKSGNNGYAVSSVPLDVEFSWGGSGNPAATVWDILVVSLGIHHQY
jgi:hypothetical protein